MKLTSCLSSQSSAGPPVSGQSRKHHLPFPRGRAPQPAAHARWPRRAAWPPGAGGGNPAGGLTPRRRKPHRRPAGRLFAARRGSADWGRVRSTTKLPGPERTWLQVGASVSQSGASSTCDQLVFTRGPLPSGPGSPGLCVGLSWAPPATAHLPPERGHVGTRGVCGARPGL